jgi:hypothetical protein
MRFIPNAPASYRRAYRVKASDWWKPIVGVSAGLGLGIGLGFMSVELGIFVGNVAGGGFYGTLLQVATSGSASWLAYEGMEVLDKQWDMDGYFSKAGLGGLTIGAAYNIYSKVPDASYIFKKAQMASRSIGFPASLLKSVPTVYQDVTQYANPEYWRYTPSIGPGSFGPGTGQ